MRFSLLAPQKGSIGFESADEHVLVHAEFVRVKRDAGASAEQHEQAREVALVEGEVLGDEERLGHELERVSEGGLSEVIEGRVVRNGRVALGKVEVIGAAVSGTGVREALLDASAGAIEHLVREDAQTAGDFRLRADGVADRTALHEAELE